MNATLSLWNAPAVDLTGADARGADLFPTISISSSNTTNFIWPDGTLYGLRLKAGQAIQIRDFAAPGALAPQALTAVPVHVTERLSMTADSTLDVRLHDLIWGSTISFDPGIPVSLGGNLLLGFDPSIDPTPFLGDSWQLFDWTGVTPTGSFSIASANPTLVWDTSNLYTTGFVTLQSVPEPAAFFLVLSIPWALAPRRRKIRN
jgi:hypothetical protein